MPLGLNRHLSMLLGRRRQSRQRRRRQSRQRLRRRQRLSSCQNLKHIFPSMSLLFRDSLLSNV